MGVALVVDAAEGVGGVVGGTTARGSVRRVVVEVDDEVVLVVSDDCMAAIALVDVKAAVSDRVEVVEVVEVVVCTEDVDDGVALGLAGAGVPVARVVGAGVVAAGAAVSPRVQYWYPSGQSTVPGS